MCQRCPGTRARIVPKWKVSGTGTGCRATGRAQRQKNGTHDGQGCVARRQQNFQLIGSDRAGFPRDSALTINTVSADQTISDVRGVWRSAGCQRHHQHADLGGGTGDQNDQWRRRGPRAQNPSNIHDDLRGMAAFRSPTLPASCPDVTGDMAVNVRIAARGRIHYYQWRRASANRAGPRRTSGCRAISGDLRFTLRNPLDAEFDIGRQRRDRQLLRPESRAQARVRTRQRAAVQGRGGQRGVRDETLNGGVEICKE